MLCQDRSGYISFGQDKAGYITLGQVILDLVFMSS
jgi:hypothetical protein